MAHADWEKAMNLLCVRLDTLGDVLMMTPAIKALKEGRPGRRVTLLTSAAGAAAAGLIPCIDESITCDAPWMKHACNDTRGDRPLPVGELRRRRFEGAVIFSTFSQSALPAALLCYMAQIPLRLAACRENPYRLLTDWVAETEPDNGIRHEVRRQLDLVGAIGCGTADETLSLAVPAAAKAEAAALLEHRGLAPGGTWLVVHPGATAPPGATPLKNSRARPMK